MNNLITEANTFLANGNFPYAFCGGFAIELFLDKEIRNHGDIDISVYWNERDNIILYMKSLGWDVFELCVNGIAHHITDITKQVKAKRNIFCFKDDCELINLKPQGERDMYYLEFDHKGQTQLNFIEYLFNDKSEIDFLYARNKEISRALSKAILSHKGIPFLCPEIVLLYKSTDIKRVGYQLDFDEAIAKMNTEQKQWLVDALTTMNPTGHLWINNCQ